jgi:hypothetical protein
MGCAANRAIRSTVPGTGCLGPGGPLSGLNLRIPLRSLDDLDDEAEEWFRRAYQANL